MSRVEPFHSVNESSKPAPRYHNNDACTKALEIPRDDIRGDTGGHILCKQCAELNAQEAAPAGLPAVG